MAKFLFVYHGGGGMPASAEEQAKAMAAWGAWFGQLGSAVTDGGNPSGASMTVTTDGSSQGGGANPTTGYSLVEASSLEEAVEKAKGCPHLSHGGSVEVCETINMM